MVGRTQAVALPRCERRLLPAGRALMLDTMVSICLYVALRTAQLVVQGPQHLLLLCCCTATAAGLPLPLNVALTCCPPPPSPPSLLRRPPRRPWPAALAWS